MTSTYVRSTTYVRYVQTVLGKRQRSILLATGSIDPPRRRSCAPMHAAPRLQSALAGRETPTRPERASEIDESVPFDGGVVRSLMTGVVAFPRRRGKWRYLIASLKIG